MVMRCAAVVALGLLVTLFTAVPSARAGEGYSRTGWYVGAGSSYAHALFESEIEDAVGVSANIEDSYGFNARIGYRILPILAFELGYEWIDALEASVNGMKGLDIEAQVVTANAKFILPMLKFQPYVLAGVGGIRYDAQDDIGVGLAVRDEAFAGRVGGGFEFYLTHHVALNASATAVLSTEKIRGVTLDDVKKLHYTVAGVGLIYRF